MPKYLIPLTIAIVVLGGGLYLYSNGNSSVPVPPTPIPTPSPVPVPTPVPSNQSVKTIQMFDDKYVPMEVTIKQGETITFINKGKNDHWPASNIHPTHTIYPGSDIRKCGTIEEKNIFDACSGIKPGASYSFKFDQIGSWRFHDHLYPELHGTIIVVQ